MTRKRKGIQTQKAKSQRDLARRLNVSRSTINRLRQDGLTCDRNGHYDLGEARELQRVRVLRMRETTSESKERREGALQLKESRLRVDLEMAEHKLAVARGEYIAKESVIREWRRSVVAVKNRLLGLGRQLAPLLQGKGPQEIQHVIDQRMFEILRLLAYQEFASVSEAEPSTLTTKET